MAKFKTSEEAYAECNAKGEIKTQEALSKERIESMALISRVFEQTAQDLMIGLDRKSLKWSIIYTLHYDTIRELAEIIALFDGRKIANHQCLFAYLCKIHPELEPDWNFFEKIRTKRNGLDYYGTFITYGDWKEVEVQAKLWINVLRKTVEEKIRNI